MKLILKKDEKLIFHLGKREKGSLLNLLQTYPSVASAPASISKGIPANEMKERQELFEESLREHREENRKQVQAMLNESGRFAEKKLGYELSLGNGEVEWLLQVLNDIRIGNWIKLGSPNPGVTSGINLTEENIRRLWQMDMAGHFEMALVTALGGDS